MEKAMVYMHDSKCGIPFLKTASQSLIVKLLRLQARTGPVTAVTIVKVLPIKKKCLTIVLFEQFCYV